MGAINFRGGYEFNPETYEHIAGGLLGRLQAIMQQSKTDPAPSTVSAPQHEPEAYASPQGGLLGRLRALQEEQSRSRPIAGTNEQPPPLQDPDLRQLSLVSNGARLPMPSSPARPAAPSQSVQQFEANQARQAREAAAGRLARGVRSAARAEAPPPDSVDIAKSTGIGVANGVVNIAGLPADVLTGFGYLPSNLLLNGLRRATGRSEIPADEPDWIRQRASADAIRQTIEKRSPWSDFYQKTTTGRYAETIGEFMPAILGGAAGATVWGARRVGLAAAAAALRELPGTTAKHAIAPGVAVQGLEEAYPESPAGQTLQKAYPVVRRALPIALAVTRYLGRRVGP